MPPSVNEQYVKRRGKGLALSEVSRRFREHAEAVVADDLDLTMGEFPTGDKEMVYAIRVWLYFDAVENEGWFQTVSRGKNKGQRKAKDRYKKLDTDNRIKFLKDAVCRAMSIPDDSQIFEDTVTKHRVKEGDQPHCVVQMSVVDPRDYFEVRDG